MTISFQLELWHLFGMATTLIGGYWGLMTLNIRQFNANLTTRFAALEVGRAEDRITAQEQFEELKAAREKDSARATERFDRLETSHKSLDRDVLMLRAELAERYVRREDAIRSEVTLHAKFDGLAARIDSVLRDKKND